MNIYEQLIDKSSKKYNAIINDIRKQNDKKRAQKEYIENLERDVAVFEQLISDPRYERFKTFLEALRKGIDINMRHYLATNYNSIKAAVYAGQIDLIDSILTQPDKLLKQYKELEVKK